MKFPLLNFLLVSFTFAPFNLILQRKLCSFPRLCLLFPIHCCKIKNFMCSNQGTFNLPRISYGEWNTEKVILIGNQYGSWRIHSNVEAINFKLSVMVVEIRTKIFMEFSIFFGLFGSTNFNKYKQLCRMAS